LSTVINPLNKDASGKPLSTSMKSTIERLRTWDSRSQDHAPVDRNLRQALNELTNLKDKLTILSSVLEKASCIYRKALERKLVRGRSISAMIAASLYAACRDADTPRTLKDITNAANVSRKDIARCYRVLHHELDLKVPVVDSIQYIARISSKLEITEKTKRYAVKILKDVQESRESAGKDPMGLAASALYISCVKNEISVTQRDVADVVGVTEVTIRNRCKELRKNIQE
jgi:transcription initiation factor TFIIB